MKMIKEVGEEEELGVRKRRPWEGQWSPKLDGDLESSGEPPMAIINTEIQRATSTSVGGMNRS